MALPLLLLHPLLRTHTLLSTIPFRSCLTAYHLPYQIGLPLLPSSDYALTVDLPKVDPIPACVVLARGVYGDEHRGCESPSCRMA